MSSGPGDPATLRDPVQADPEDGLGGVRPGDRGGPIRSRRGRRRRHRDRPPRSRVLRIVLLAASLGLLALVVVIVDGYVQAYRIARQAEETYPKLNAVRRALLEGRVPEEEDLAAAMEQGRRLEQGVAGARFTFGLTGSLPWVGRPVDAVRLGATAVTETTLAAEIASALVADLFGEEGRPSPVLHDGRVDLTLILAARPRVEELAAHVHAAADAIREIPRIPFFGRLEELKADVLADAEEAARLADRAVSGFRLLPSLLGAEAPQTYFVALQNNADQRGTGGAVLAYALMRMDEGRIELVRSGSINELHPDDRRVLRVGLHQDLKWYLRATGRPPLVGNGVNYSPQFPKVARVWAEQVSTIEGIDVQGVIAVDPHGVAYALKGQDEFRVPLYRWPIHSGNVVKITEHDQYTLPREQQLALPALIVEAAFERLVNPRSVLDMGKHLATAFAEKRIQVWSASEEIQGLIEELDWEGGLDVEPGDFLMVTMNKRLANKVDYFTRQEIDHRVTVSPGGDARAVTTVRLVNETPPSEPQYIAGKQEPYALNVSLVSVFVPGRARGVELTPDEPLTTLARLRPKHFLVHREARTRVFTKMMEAWPGHPAELTFTYEVPGIVRDDSEGQSVFHIGVGHQPLAVPADLSVTIVLPEGSVPAAVPAGWTVQDNMVSFHGPLIRDIGAEIVFPSTEGEDPGD